MAGESLQRDQCHRHPAADLSGSGLGGLGVSIDPGGTYRLASYDYIVSGGGLNGGAIPQFGGYVPFKVEQTIPGSFGFWQIVPSGASPRPAASYVGTFSIDATGSLSFTAGPAAVSVTPPNITAIARVGTLNTVSFTTTVGGNYYLLYTNSIAGGGPGAWPVVSGPVTGTGGNQSLTHTATDTTGFYSVERTP